MRASSRKYCFFDIVKNSVCVATATEPLFFAAVRRMKVKEITVVRLY